METVLIVVHLLIVIALGATVLLQKSEGGALGIGGGGSGGFFTGRGQANLLTRTTAILGTLFFLTSLALSVLAGVSRAPQSVIDSVAPAGSTAPAQGSGGLLDQLKGLQNQSAPPAPPSAPSLPTPSAPTAPKN